MFKVADARLRENKKKNRKQPDLTLTSNYKNCL